MKFQTITGFRDILPPESAAWSRVEQTACELFGTYGYSEIRLPILERVELFARSIGAETDVVSKEMYRFEDHEIPELGGLIRTLGHPTWGKPYTVQAFVDNVRDLLCQLDNALKSAGIPRTPENRKATIELQTLLDPIARASGGDNFIGQNDLDLYADQIKRTALTIVLGDSLALRPEATASVVRAYIEHGMHLKPGNVKLCYVGPMFRREKPQKGRYRQFYQIGAELLGPSDHPAIDAEVIEMLMTLFERLKLNGTTLYLNSIGDKNCRPAYVEKLREDLRKVKDRLGPDSQRRIETNPLRVLDSKLAEEQPIIANLPHIADHLCDDCRAHYAKLKEELALRGVAFEENWRLVRGLDYYMRTTFEITATGLGSQNAVCGGGRYDGLVELLGGPATTKGIGFAIGTDRLMLSLEQAGQGQVRSNIDVYVAWFGMPTYAPAVALARRLRGQGFAVEMPAAEMKFGKSLSLADRLGARYAVILGEAELAAKQFTVKRLADGEQKKLAEAELFEYLRGAAS